MVSFLPHKLISFCWKKIKFVRNTRISSGVTLTNWVGRLSNQWKIRKVNHFLGGVLVIQTSWILLNMMNNYQTSHFQKRIGTLTQTQPKIYTLPPRSFDTLKSAWAYSSQQNIFLWFFPFSQTHLVDNLLLLHVVKCLRGHRINNSLTHFLSTVLHLHHHVCQLSGQVLRSVL